MNRNFFASLFLFLVLFSGAFSPVLSLVSPNFTPQVAHAQTPPPTQPGTTSETPPPAENPTELDCGTNFVCGLVNVLVYLGMFLPNLFAQVSGMILDYTVWKNLDSSTWTSQDTVDSFVVKGWKIVRDFSNLLFIFALFVVGFSLILNGVGTEGRPLFGLDPKRTIARVILMALLINLSFFMCRAIIDITNLFGRVFYHSITETMKKSGQDPTNSGYNQNQTISSKNSEDKVKEALGNTSDFYTNMSGVRSISLAVINKTNPQQLILATAGDGTFEGSGIFWKSYDSGVYILLLFVAWIVGIFNLFLVYLFISSAIFLISRIFGLYFLIILSPIAFVSTTIPALQAKEYFGFDDWFKQFTGLAFCMPIYLFFFWLGIQFLGFNVNTTSKMGYIAAAAVIMIKLAMMGAVLIFGKKISKDLSGKIGAMASGAVNGLITGTAMVAGAALTGGASAALRMGGGLARNAAINTVSRVGEATVGKDNVEAIRQRFSSGNFKSFSRLNNFNPMRGMSDQRSITGGITQLGRNFGAGLGEAARMSGSQLPDQLGAAYRTGKLTPRAESIARAREEREKKVKALNEEIDRLRQQMRNPNLTQAERQALNQQVKGKQGEIWNLNNPTPPGQNGQQQNTQQPPVPPANTPAVNAQQNPAQPTAAAAGTNAPTPTTTSGGTTQGTGGVSTPTANRTVDASLVNNAGNTSPLSPEQTKQIATDIENEMRSLEKEMNDPATRLNKDRMQELESKYNGLDKERKELGQGTVLPARLKSFAGQPVGQLAPKPKTFGEGNSGKSLSDFNSTQQDRVRRKAIEKQERMATKAVAQAKGTSKAQSLLSGIATGTAAAVAPTVEQTVGGMDQSGVVETPDTMDFGGMQIPEPGQEKPADASAQAASQEAYKSSYGAGYYNTSIENAKNIDQDPRYREILQDTHHELLKEHDSKYYNENYSGMSPQGTLVNKNDKDKMYTLPSMIDFHTKDGQFGPKIAEEQARKKFFEQYPDAANKYSQ